jgi:hypothetical protein
MQHRQCVTRSARWAKRQLEGELRAHLVQTLPAHGLQWDDAPPAIATLARPLTSLAPR